MCTFAGDLEKDSINIQKFNNYVLDTRTSLKT